MCSEGLRERYVNPYTDFAFKLLFGTDLNKEILIGFLNALFSGRQVIQDVTYLNTEHLGSREADRRAVFDVYCENEKGEKILIEMQCGERYFFKEQSIYYSTFPIREHVIKGAIWDYKLTAAYIICMLNFTFDDTIPSCFYHEVKLIDTITNKVFFDNVSFIYLEMPKFHKTEQELENLFDKWMFALKNLACMKERPVALQEGEFNHLFEAAEIANFSSENFCSYMSSLKEYWDWNSIIKTAIQKGEAKGMEKAMAKGIAEGELIKAKAIARNLKNAGLSVTEIAAITGLSADEVNSL